MNSECSIWRVLIFGVNFAPGYPRRYTANQMDNLPRNEPQRGSENFRRDASCNSQLFISILAFGAAIATVPFYGYFVRAPLNSQITGVCIMLCWLLACVFAILSVFFLLSFRCNSNAAKGVFYFLVVYLFAAVYVGWGGVHLAITELLVG